MLHSKNGDDVLVYKSFIVIVDDKSYGAPTVYGPCDGVRGAAKRRVDEAVKRGVALIQTARDFFDWGNAQDTAISYLFTTSGHVMVAEMDAWQTLKVPRIMATHSAMVKGPFVFTQDVSCCFNTAGNSLMGGFPDFLRFVFIESFATKNMFEMPKIIYYLGRS